MDSPVKKQRDLLERALARANSLSSSYSSPCTPHRGTVAGEAPLSARGSGDVAERFGGDQWQESERTRAQKEIQTLKDEREGLRKQLDDIRTVGDLGPHDHIKMKSRELEEKAREIFVNFTKTHPNEKMTETEFKDAVSAAATLQSGTLDELFHDMDTNQDKFISFDEWKAFFDAAPIMQEFAGAESEGDMREHATVSRFSFLPSARAMFVTTEKFDAGVEGLIGRADPNTKRAIRAEHCLSDDSFDDFETSNTKIQTTSWKEYWLVVRDEDDNPPSRMPEFEKEDHRVFKPIKELLEHPSCKEAELSFEEVVSLRLYSGPMYMKYNTILREFPVELLHAFKGNRYTTTIHLILSGILKLSRVQPIPKERLVYRGLGGKRLPKEFYIQDKTLSKGGVEAAFMSTTVDKGTALKYSNSGSGENGKSIIFEIQLGKMSTGADISFASQYPKEFEILFTPLTHLEIVGQPTDGEFELGGEKRRVYVVRLRATTNQKSLTLEKLRIERWTMLQDLGRKLVNEIKQLLDSGAQQGADFVHLAMGPMQGSENEQYVSRSPSCEGAVEVSTSFKKRTADEGIEHLKKRIEDEVSSVEKEAFNDMTIYQDTSIRLFDGFVEARRMSAEKLMEAASDEQSEDLRTKLWACKVAAHLISDVPEKEQEILVQHRNVRKRIVQLLERIMGEAGTDTSKSGPPMKLLGRARLDYAACLQKEAQYKDALDLLKTAKEGLMEEVKKEEGVMWGQSADEVKGSHVLKGLRGDYAESIEREGLVQYELRDLKNAMECFKMVEKMRVANSTGLPADHFGVAEALVNQGRVCFRNGKKEESLALYVRAFELREKNGGAITLEMAKMYQHRSSVKEPQGAIEDLDKSLEIIKKLLGPDNLETANIWNLKGKPLEKLKRFKEAKDNLEKSLETKKRILGSKHPQVSRTCSNLADHFYYHYKFENEMVEKAIEFHQKALDINIFVYTEKSKHVKNNYEAIAKIYKEQDEAFQKEDRDAFVKRQHDQRWLSCEMKLLAFAEAGAPKPDSKGRLDWAKKLVDVAKLEGRVGDRKNSLEHLVQARNMIENDVGCKTLGDKETVEQRQQLIQKLLDSIEEQMRQNQAHSAVAGVAMTASQMSNFKVSSLKSPVAE